MIKQVLACRRGQIRQGHLIYCMMIRVYLDNLLFLLRTECQYIGLILEHIGERNHCMSIIIKTEM